jgi:hypothetical protein
MSVCNISFTFLLLNISHGAQLNAQVETQMLRPVADDVFGVLQARLTNQAESLPNIRNRLQALRGLQTPGALWDDIERNSLEKWRKAFQSNGVTGSSSGSIVAISNEYILKSESSSFYKNWEVVFDSYLNRARDDDSCLQKIVWVFKTGTVSDTYWFVIKNSNAHAGDRNLIRFDLKEGRRVGKSSGFTGAKGELGFTDDFFYLKDLQSWEYTEPLAYTGTYAQTHGKNTKVRAAIEADLQIFTDAWNRVENPIKLVDFSILVFINMLPIGVRPDNHNYPSNCVPFTRLNPYSGEVEHLEMCFSIIDFLADLSLGKNQHFAQERDALKVYGKHDKFDSEYAAYLNRMMDLVLETETDVRNETNLANHYVPQARARFQKNAMDLAAEYLRKFEVGNRSSVAFAAYYHIQFSQGLPKTIVEPLYTICELGLSTKDKAALPRFVEIFNISRSNVTPDAKWAVIEKKVANLGISGRHACELTAAQLTTKCNRLNPPQGVDYHTARMLNPSEVAGAAPPVLALNPAQGVGARKQRRKALFIQRDI